MNKFKKIISILLISSLMFSQVSFIALAEEVITEPTPEVIASTPAPTPQTPERAGFPAKADKPEKADKPLNADAPVHADVPEAIATPTPSPEVTNLINDEVEHGGVTQDGNVGDTIIETGDANNAGNILNYANNNIATGCGTCTDSGTGDSASIVNNGNGANSNNNGSANIVDNNTTNQDNSATVLNNMTQASITGDNSASKNVGNSTITTGDANVTGTIITSANTNVDGVAVSEFNIVGDHMGDYILDFGANCISGCGGSSTSVANTNNGADSDNNAIANQTTNNTTNQLNDGDVTNNMILLADSGHNDADKNTGGDSSIITGDANVAANVITFLNNNIAGNVAYGVVNIFGQLIGDIILPDNAFDLFGNCSTCGANNLSAANTGNGADSNNNGALNNTTNNNTFQSNDANIQNNLIFNTETGENSASKNTNGDVDITTGSTLVDANILNIANMNLLGGNMWLVIINDAGNWIGKLMGAEDGSSLAGSQGMEFGIDPTTGQINVTNAGNGAESTNNGAVNNTTNNTLNQTNNANVVNNINLSAITGKNSADKNTGGDSSIVTGDAQAIANIVNFVNNNIAGGKLLVTFVNVFGGWKGDFIAPGQTKATTQNPSANNNSNNSNDSSGSSSTNSSNSVTNRVMAASAGFFGKISQPQVVNNEANSGSVKVAGINNTKLVAGINSQDETVKGTATINLAWLIFALPLVIGAGILARKRYLKRTV